MYGLGAKVMTENVARAIRMASNLEAGSVWVAEMAVPFGGFKQSGMGKEFGQYALDAYTQVKAVHINIGQRL